MVPNRVLDIRAIIDQSIETVDAYLGVSFPEDSPSTDNDIIRKYEVDNLCVYVKFWRLPEFLDDTDRPRARDTICNLSEYCVFDTDDALALIGLDPPQTSPDIDSSELGLALWNNFLPHYRLTLFRKPRSSLILAVALQSLDFWTVMREAVGELREAILETVLVPPSHLDQVLQRIENFSSITSTRISHEGRGRIAIFGWNRISVQQAVRLVKYPFCLEQVSPDVQMNDLLWFYSQQGYVSYDDINRVLCGAAEDATLFNELIERLEGEGVRVVFAYQNSEGVLYYLHKKEVVMPDGRSTEIYLFTRSVSDLYSSLARIPDGFALKETKSTHQPIIVRVTR